MEDFDKTLANYKDDENLNTIANRNLGVTKDERKRFIEKKRNPVGLNKYGGTLEILIFSIIENQNIWTLMNMNDKNGQNMGYMWQTHAHCSTLPGHKESASLHTNYRLLYTNYGNNMATAHYQAIIKEENDEPPKCGHFYEQGFTTLSKIKTKCDCHINEEDRKLVDMTKVDINEDQI